MNVTDETTSTPDRARAAEWLGLGLALVAAGSYALMGLGVLGAGDADGPPGVLAAAATCYVAGGLLILARRRGLWITGAVINGLLLLFFFQAYAARPLVLFSPGALVSKAAQVVLEACLVYLIARTWLQSREGGAQPPRARLDRLAPR